MSDFKFYPAALPRPLQTGYAIKHKSNMLRTQMSDGYVRQRLVNQGAPDSLSVQMIMTELEYRTLLEWYKADIQCGASWFVMPLLSVDIDSDEHIQYRYVRIQNGEIDASVVSTNATEGTIYRVTMSLDASNTIVDDGTWHDGGAHGDDVIADLSGSIERDDVLPDDADSIDDIIGTYTMIQED